MTALVADGLGKRYRRHWALRDCSVTIPSGATVGLVGANGAGKSTFLHLAVGLLDPSEGTIAVLGSPPDSGTDARNKVGFLAQDAPAYPTLTVAEHLLLGQHLNPTWDHDFAVERVAHFGLPASQRAGRLSGGQRSQLALTLAMAKRPELLVLDEPVASLDPLARREFLADLMALVVEHHPTVVLASHLLADVERVCDHLIVLAAGRVCLAGAVDDLLATHKVLTGPRRDPNDAPDDHHVITVSHTERQTTLVVRTDGLVFDPRLAVTDISLEDLVLAYMERPPPPPLRHLTVAAS